MCDHDCCRVYLRRLARDLSGVLGRCINRAAEHLLFGDKSVARFEKLDRERFVPLVADDS